MIGRHTSWLRNLLYVVGALSLVVMGLAACGQTATNNTAPSGPIKIGVSLSLSGDFQADGQFFQQGYQLWAADVNKSGGLLGRQVSLDILSDNSDPNQVVTNYNKLISSDKVDLVLGPYSSLLTKPASAAVNRYGYAMLEGAGGAPSVFQQGLNNVFDVSLPVANNLLSFADYLISLPDAQKPKSIAYATEDDPFTQPQIDIVRAKLEGAGFKTAYYDVYPAETTDFTPIANKVIQSGAQVDILGTMLPDIVSFVQTFKQQHYNPQAIIATAGPDQGADFIKGVGGAASAEGILVPNGWYAEANNPGNAQMVQEYVAKYGGKPDDISADVAEAYSVGQVLQQAVEKIKSIDNAKLIAELHSGDTFQTVQGNVKFDNTGQNTAATAYLFQWQNGNFIPVFPANAAGAGTIEYPKKPWPTS
jgi:branched-chain amino acid transport system substrate-binding protein